MLAKRWTDPTVGWLVRLGSTSRPQLAVLWEHHHHFLWERLNWDRQVEEEKNAPDLHTHARTCTHTHTHTYIHTYTHTHTNSFSLSLLHTHPRHIHTQIHKTHTHIHMHIMHTFTHFFPSNCSCFLNAKPSQMFNSTPLSLPPLIV